MGKVIMSGIVPPLSVPTPIPKKPTKWTFYQAINADTTWTPPKTGEWYRIHVFGKCGDGGKSSGDRVGTNNYATNGFAGGNSGGYACSDLFLIDSVPCTVNNSITSFGSYLSATSGGSTPNGSGWGDDTDMLPSDVVGVGTGGTEYNMNGVKGTNGHPKRESHYSDGSDSYVGGNGGNGGRFAKPYPDIPYIDDTTSFSAGTGARSIWDSGATNYGGTNAKSYPALDLNNPVIYGAGQGGGGNADAGSNAAIGGNPSKGSPGLIIIERGVIE